jgi:hypothetical protein
MAGLLRHVSYLSFTSKISCQLSAPSDECYCVSLVVFEVERSEFRVLLPQN